MIIKTRYKMLAYSIALAFINTEAQALFMNASVTGNTTLLTSSHKSISDKDGMPNVVSVSSNPALSIGRFNSHHGVLLGLTATLKPGNNSMFLRAEGGGSDRGNAFVATTWNGEGGLGVFGTLNIVSKNNNVNGSNNGWVTRSQVISNSANLDNWVGSGNVNTSLTTTLTAIKSGGDNLTARISSSGANNDETLADLTADFSVVYNYLQHATPSLDGNSALPEITLDFGTVYLGDTVTALGFSLFNLTGDRVGLDLDVITGSGDTSVLTTDLTPFSALSAGNDHNFTATINTSSPGSFNASYSLSFSDADVGAASSRYSFNNYLTLNLQGTVINKALPNQITPIPEPDTFMLIGIGMLGFLGFARRQKKN